jgi:membrane protein DedA with SNARE-associated domain
MIFEFFSNFIGNFIGFIGKIGYLGIFIGMTLESTFFPLPSEIILIPAGVLIAKGEFSFFLLLLASVLGSVLGALINYSIALFVGRTAIDALVENYGKFFFVTKKGLARSEKFFDGYGEISTFIGRLLPGVRHLISIPAGFFRMKLSSFILFTALGSGIWTCILLAIGYFFNEISLETWTENSFILYLISFLICIIALIIYLVINQKKRRESHPA